MLSMLMLMLAQQVTGPPGDEADPPRPGLTGQRRCAQGAEDIVVCAERQSQRLSPLPPREPQRVFGPAAARLSPNKSVSLQAQESQNPFSKGPRAMVSFKLDF